MDRLDVAFEKDIAFIAKFKKGSRGRSDVGVKSWKCLTGRSWVGDRLAMMEGRATIL